MLGQAVLVRLVSERLGHASAGLALNVYAHVLPGHEVAEEEDVAAVLAGERAPEPLPEAAGP